jgi:hypothetical protein
MRAEQKNGTWIDAKRRTLLKQATLALLEQRILEPRLMA